MANTQEEKLRRGNVDHNEDERSDTDPHNQVATTEGVVEDNQEPSGYPHRVETREEVREEERGEGESLRTAESSLVISTSPLGVGAEHTSTEEEGRADEGNDGHEEDAEEIEALKPMNMYFPPCEYKKKIRISTRCYIKEALDTLNKLKPPLSQAERTWFEDHPQFKHFFHMPSAKNHKVMGIWMLLLRTACIEKKKEVWFVVNGVPIRYGIKEHALISGLNSCNYPLGYKSKGSYEFVQTHIKRSTIRIEDVKAKLQEMVPDEKNEDRLRMAVLFFLASIIIGPRKTGIDASPVEDFFMRAVEDLNFCKTFPWGRLSFDHMLGEISYTMGHYHGVVKEGVAWPFPGFCIPLELLAYEAIPVLRSNFLDDVTDADINFPRMCKSRFKRSENKGFPLSVINEKLGTTKEIDSILCVRDEERSLMRRITEEDGDNDIHDVVVNSWMKRLDRGYTVQFTDMYDEDVASRLLDGTENAGTEEIGTTGNMRLRDIVYGMLTEMLEGSTGNMRLRDIVYGMLTEMLEGSTGNMRLRDIVCGMITEMLEGNTVNMRSRDMVHGLLTEIVAERLGPLVASMMEKEGNRECPTCSKPAGNNGGGNSVGVAEDTEPARRTSNRPRPTCSKPAGDNGGGNSDGVAEYTEPARRTSNRPRSPNRKYVN